MPILDYSANIKASHAVIYPIWERGKYYAGVRPESNKQVFLSDKSMTRIRNAANLLIECSTRKTIYSLKDNRKFSYKVGFMTLTLPEQQKHTDRDFHRLVTAPFIRRLKEQYDLSEYIWKAEAQDNNNIHYHFTINQFIHHRDINMEWNKQLEKVGYSFLSENHRKATTQIKATKSIKNLAGYLCGYLSKKDYYKKAGKDFIKANTGKKTERTDLPGDFFICGGAYRKRKLDVKLWDCSDNLKNKKCSVTYLNHNHPDIFDALIQCSQREIRKDFFSVWMYERNDLMKHKATEALWKEFIDSVKMHGKQMEKYYVESLK